MNRLLRFSVGGFARTLNRPQHLAGIEGLPGNRPVSPRPMPASLRALIKRTFDIVVSLAMLTAMLLPLLVIAVAIKLDSPGPVFYRVRRVGYRGAPLMMVKFRKMRHGSMGPPLTALDDSRLTRIGKLLVLTRLDEVPQLWDVVRGRMSIVGPRPEDPGFVALNAEAYSHILSVRPGVTGLSQLAFAQEQRILNEQDRINDYVHRILPQKIGLDTLYADEHRLRMDVAVLWWTLAAIVLRRPVAVHRTTGDMNIRRRARVAPQLQEAEAAVFADA